MNRIRLNFFVAILSVAFPSLVFPFATQPPPAGYTGAARFRENSCVECHGTGASGNVTLTFNGAAATTYTPGTSIPIRITITDTGGNRRRWGFELAARFTNGMQAGDFATVSSSPSTTVFSDQSGSFPQGGTIRWATHFVPSVLAPATTFTYTMMWTAPPTSAGGDIFFNVAGNAANGDLTSSGDRIYTSEVKLTAAAGNPVPAVSSLAPSSAQAGGASFTLTVNGSGFQSNSVVQWNGTTRITTFVSATQLTAAITSGDIASAGTASVTVFTPTPGGGTSAAATFNILGPAPIIVQGGTVNSATLVPAPNDQIARGQIISIFGANLTVGGPFGPDRLPLPTTLGPTTVKIGGTAIPLFAVFGTQINAQLPFELPDTGTQQLTVTSGSQTTAPVNITLAATSPGIYTVASSGVGDGIILHVNNQLVTPSNPAIGGEIVVIYCTGLGSTKTLVPSGTASNGEVTNAMVTVTIGGQPAPVAFAGLVPTLVGLYQINVTVPMVTGSQPVIITAGAAKSPSGVTMSVK